MLAGYGNTVLSTSFLVDLTDDIPYDRLVGRRLTDASRDSFMAVRRNLAFKREAIYEFDVVDALVTVAVDTRGNPIHDIEPAAWRQTQRLTSPHLSI